MYRPTNDSSEFPGQILTEEMVSRYLARKPNFVKRWFKDNATNDLLNDCIRLKEQNEFLTKPRASVTHEMFNNIIQGHNSNRTTSANSQIVDYMHLNENELFFELIRDIANELNVDIVCHKILTNVSILTNSDRGSLFLARGPKDARYLVSKLFDVTAGSTLEQSLHNEDQQIIIPFGKGIAGHVASAKEYINIRDAYEDPRFNKEVDNKTGYRTHSICCMPILNRDNIVIGVAQIINKKTGTHEFTDKDISVFRNYLTFCGLGLSNAQLFELSIQEYKKNQLLLNLARNLFREQDDLEHLVNKITTESQGLMQCARCCVYIIDRSISSSNKPEDIHFSKGFDMVYGEEFKVTTNDFLENSRYAKIAYHVATTMEIVNINEISNDQTLSHLLASDDNDKFELKNLLCVPIMDDDGHVIGVSQVMNKLHGRAFTEDDVAIIEAFSVFCGLGIHNTRQYENVVRLTAKQNVAFEVLSYHAVASEEDVQRTVNISIPEANQLRLYSWEFNDMILTDDETILASIRMFVELDLLKIYRIPHDVMCRWTLSVKKNYRSVIYHNWRHAFNVAQTMFSMLTTGGMNARMNDLERIGLLIACLSHDLDHRGTNNAFQAKVDAPLAKLYSTSTLEHHHFDQCIMILQTEGNNILQTLSPDDYKLVVHYIEAAILATDLAVYFRRRGDFQKLVESRQERWIDPGRKDLLRGMMMTACDVAAICKPWEMQQVIAKLVATEFFQQGDIERNQLHVEPIPMMDRDKKDELPKMQVGFIDSICLPVYKMLAEVESGLSPLYEGCKRNRENWEKLQQEHDKLKSLWSDSVSQEALYKIFAASKTSLQEKNLDSTPINKLTKKTNNDEIPSVTTVNREQQTTSPLIDPLLIATIHGNKGAIDTIRGQIIELRHDVDQLRIDINNQRTKTLALNTETTRRISKSEINTLNQTAVCNRHHDVEPAVTRKRSTVCIII
ncbi:unnamed protein product [Rotaria sp. Silwood1]|nr:unnamed protein product [Rotaria sp. Silwood1]CAF3478401.1 unnamed protein product [Rotaria sp. Silwood1]CAF4683265.1 unnamed protein product [Rotaria sp. Silwood1]CAF4741195.1 unnamed protein product [Rotaria sp. Silwood1]